MQAHVLRGTKQQIAENLAQMPGVIREAVVFVEEPLAEARKAEEDIFAEMRPYMVDVDIIGLDDTREAVYTRGEAE